MIRDRLFHLFRKRPKKTHILQPFKKILKNKIWKHIDDRDFRAFKTQASFNVMEQKKTVVLYKDSRQKITLN